MQLQEHVVWRLLNMPAEALVWSLTLGEKACLVCLITKNRPEVGLQRAG